MNKNHNGEMLRTTNTHTAKVNKLNKDNNDAVNRLSSEHELNIIKKLKL